MGTRIPRSHPRPRSSAARSWAPSASFVESRAGSPRMWRPTNYTEQDFSAFRERLARSSVGSVFIHAVYLINCASEDREIRGKSIQSLAHALSVGEAIGAGGVVVHPGSGKGGAAKPTLDRIADAFRQALRASKDCPLLPGMSVTVHVKRR